MSTAEQAALASAQAFCSELFAGVDESLDGYQATVLVHPGPSVRWIVGLDPAEIASAVREADTRAGADGADRTAVYLSMAPRRPDIPHRHPPDEKHPNGRPRRGYSTDVGALLGVWADLDIAGDAHVSGKHLPPDVAAVRRIVDACGLPPTLLWSSGHGLQAFWGLHEPWVFADDPDPEHSRRAAEKLVRHWQLTLAMHAHRLGQWQLDATHDLARVLRPAGTTNRKITGDHRRVEVLPGSGGNGSGPGPRYDVSDLEEHLAEAEYLEKFAGMAEIPADSPVAKVDLHAVWAMVNSRPYRERNYTPEWLLRLRDDEVLTDDDRLIDVFENGHPSGDPSSTDASLARHVADLDLTARDAVEIIMCRRLRAKDKVDKIDPNRRQGYVRTTVAKVFATAQEAREKHASLTKAGDNAAEAAQAAFAPAPAPAPGGAGGALPRPGDQDATTAAGAAQRGLRGLGAATARELDDDVAATRPDPAGGIDITADITAEPEPDPPAEPEPDPPTNDGEVEPGPAVAPSAGTDETEHDAAGHDETPASEPDDIPDPAASEAAGADAAPGADETAEGEIPLPPEPDEPDQPEGAQQTPQDGQDGPQHAGPFIGDDADGADPLGVDRDGADDQHHDAPTADRPVAGRSRSAWGSRTEHQHGELDALSETLLGPASRYARIWRCQTRGRGAKAERRLVMRFHRDVRWPVHPPIGYVPGEPYATGWWPAATFGKLAGWQRVLEQECLMITAKVKGEDFVARFGRSLIHMWEPDDSGGSLENVTRDGMVSYLLDYPPMTEWSDAAAQGMPLISQPEPRWALGTNFTVLVRWADFGQHVRTRYAINVTPAVLSEMAELAGARTMRTQSQDGRWRMVRREYLSDDEWRAVLAAGEIAAQQREDRHGMHIAGTNPYAGADAPEHARRPDGTTGTAQ